MEAVLAQFKERCRRLSEVTKKTSDNLSQNYQLLGRDMDSGLPEYETGVALTRPRDSVNMTSKSTEQLKWSRQN
jgi:hypothetical protein